MNITDAEWKVMEFLWDEAPLTVRQLTERLEPVTQWKRHTVISFLNRLEAKGAVEKQERTVYQYIPLVSREEAAKVEAQSFFEKVKPDSLMQLFSYFTPDDKLTKKEQKALQDLIERLDEGHKES